LLASTEREDEDQPPGLVVLVVEVSHFLVVHGGHKGTEIGVYKVAGFVVIILHLGDMIMFLKCLKLQVGQNPGAPLSLIDLTHIHKVITSRNLLMRRPTMAFFVFSHTNNRSHSKKARTSIPS
jgi:hypothetical protein